MTYSIRPLGVQDLLKVHHIRLFRLLGVFFGSQVRDSASRQAANPAPPSRLRSVIGDDGHFKVVAMLRLKRAAHLDRIAAAAIRCHPFHFAPGLPFNRSHQRAGIRTVGSPEGAANHGHFHAASPYCGGPAAGRPHTLDHVVAVVLPSRALAPFRIPLSGLALSAAVTGPRVLFIGCQFLGAGFAIEKQVGNESPG